MNEIQFVVLMVICGEHDSFMNLINEDQLLSKVIKYIEVGMVV